MARVPASRALTFFLLAAGGFAADLASKSVVFARLGFPDGTTGWLLDGWLKFRLYTTFNHGALWGVGQGMTWLFAVLSVAAIVGVFYWLFWAGAARSWWLARSRRPSWPAARCTSTPSTAPRCRSRC